MAVNREKLVDALLQLPLVPDERGIIPVFGSYLIMADNEFMYKMMSRILFGVNKEKSVEVEADFTKAVLECAYHTFYGVTSSAEWEGVAGPMIENKEDKIHALVALTDIFGAGRIEITELIPNEKLVMRVKNSIDPPFWLKEHGKQERPRCYVFTACAAGYMDLVYGEEYPKGLGNFESKEIKCRAKGDEYCEFVATRIK